MPDKQHAVIVGAGIIGVSCAIYLQRAGYRVTILDARPVGTGCSFGNAGIIAPGACIPLAMPGIWRKVPRFLLNPLGPLAIRWQDAIRYMPWLIAWLAASTPDRVRATSAGMRDLHRSALIEFRDLLRDIGAPDLLTCAGQLYVSSRENGAKSSPFATELLRVAGVRAQILKGGEVQELEPSLSVSMVSGLYFPDHGHTTNPYRLVRQLADEVLRRDGQVVLLNAKAFEFEGDKVAAVICENGPIRSDIVVIAAGAWSHKLTALLGTKIPLVAERGYNITLPNAGCSPRIPLINVDHRLAVTPMEEGLRISGTVEIADVDAQPNFRRSAILLKHGKAMFPSLQDTGSTIWMGGRPSLPDGLPLIDRSPHFTNALFAIGHSHYGLTGCAVTARLVTELAIRQSTFVDQKPYAMRKF